MRLNARHWLAVFCIVAALALFTPALWKRIERFETGPDYRVPYPLSKDYWLYQRRVAGLGAADVPLIGDSVIWGEYVLPEGTLSHFLNEETGGTRFVNAGVNGLFPLALEGLQEYYGGSLRRRKIILHCNLLWMSSPKADLQGRKEEKFNHSRLVPQYVPRIQCYKAETDERLGAIFERNCGFMQWANHLQMAYFEQKSIPGWTLENDGGSPPRYPNVYKSPLSRITLAVPTAPSPDLERGPASARHKPWSKTSQGTTQFEWVPLESSLQWAAFQRLVSLLRGRGNDVFVIVGPFNEHMMTQENRRLYLQRRDAVASWLKNNQIHHVVPEPLPSALYADASHPLTDGYKLLANRIQPELKAWLSMAK